MAEFIPLSTPEKNNDASWYTAIGAGLVSGLIKTVEGVVSLGAELVDLGADSNVAADVEKFFDKVNIFEDTADDRVVGKLTEALIQIGIPGAIGFKTATKLADKAIKAKRAGNYANFKSANAMNGLTKAKSLNSRIDRRLGLKPGSTTRFQAGVFGGAAGETFVADVEDIGSFGDLFQGGPTQLDRDQTTGREDAARKLMNRVKFGSESLLITPFVYGAGKSIKALAKRGKDDAYANSSITRWIDRYIGGSFTPRGMLPEQVFDAEVVKGGLKSRDRVRAKQLVYNITKEADAIIPRVAKIFNKPQEAQTEFYKKLNDVLFEGDLAKPANGKANDAFISLLEKAGIKENDYQNILTNMTSARSEFSNLISILERNADTPGAISAGKKDLKEILAGKVKGWIGNTYKVLDRPKSGLSRLFQDIEPTDEAYANSINLFRRFLAKTDPVRIEKIDNLRKNLTTKGLTTKQIDKEVVKKFSITNNSEYFEQAKYTVDDIINQARLKKKAAPLPDITYQNKTGQTFTKSFAKAKGKGSKSFRKLFGEIEDPRYSIFNAMTNLSGAARTASYFDDIARKNKEIQDAGGRGFFWKTDDAAKRAVNSPQTNIEIVKMDKVIDELPGAGAVINPLRNAYTTKEIADSMKNINGVASGLTAAIRGREGANPAEKAVSFMYRNLLLLPKAVSQLAKTVLSIPTHIRNFFSAGAFAGANGILFEGLTNPKLLAKSFLDGIDISNLVRLGPGSPQAQKAYQEALELGLTNTQVQIGDFINLLKDAVPGVRNETGVAAADGILKGMMGKLKKLGQFLQGKYVAEDDTWKLTNFAVELDALKRAAVETARRQGKTIDVSDIALGKPSSNPLARELKQQAADIVKNTVPNYAFVGSAVRASRILPIGNFMSFPSEVMRTTTGIAEQGLKEIRHSRPTRGSNVLPYVVDAATGQLVKNDNVMYGRGFKRLSGMAFTTVAVPEMIVEGAKAIYNVTEDEIRALRQFVPDWSKNSTIVPIRDDDGELRYIDFSHSNAYDVIARPFNTLFNNILESQQDDRTLLSGFVRGVDEAGSELMNPFISESIWTEAMNDLVSRGGRTKEGRRLYTDQTPVGDKVKIRFLHLGEALVPSYKQGLRLIQATTETPTSRGELLDVGPEIAGFMGLRAIKVDPLQSMGFKISEYQSGIRDARREFTGGYFGLLRGGRIKENDVIQKFYASNQARFNVQKEMYKNINAAEILGVDSSELRATFKERQLSTSTFSNLQDGIFDPYFPSRDIQDRFREIADDLGDINVFPEVSDTLREMADEFRELDLSGSFDINLNDYLLQDIGVAPIPQQVATATPIVQPPAPVAQQNKLTQTQLALLSPEEQIIALRNKNRTV